MNRLLIAVSLLASSALVVPVFAQSSPMSPPMAQGQASGQMSSGQTSKSQMSGGQMSGPMTSGTMSTNHMAGQPMKPHKKHKPAVSPMSNGGMSSTMNSQQNNSMAAPH